MAAGSGPDCSETGRESLRGERGGRPIWCRAAPLRAQCWASMSVVILAKSSCLAKAKVKARLQSSQVRCKRLHPAGSGNKQLAQVGHVSASCEGRRAGWQTELSCLPACLLSQSLPCGCNSNAWRKTVAFFPPSVWLLSPFQAKRPRTFRAHCACNNLRQVRTPWQLLGERVALRRTGGRGRLLVPPPEVWRSKFNFIRSCLLA